ncbi:YoaK family protein [Tardiphaga sp. 862_B3_N4_1]|uniref:YoaK family protein n=1 Tax=Tardiphaga sp. 862_B3_N4_1 TaxID=3240764 RepID=UPI003F2715A8
MTRTLVSFNSARVPAHPVPTWKMLAQATLMTTLAGYVDGLGYTAMGHLYLSFMSGNSTQLGAAVAAGNAYVMAWAGAVIGTFVLGAFVGTIVHSVEPKVRLPLVLVCELASIIAAWSLGSLIPINFALLLVAFAMGMQNCLQKVVAGAATGKSFITGSLFGTGHALAQLCLGRAHVSEAVANAISWLAFVLGATGGALGVNTMGPFVALQIASGFVLLMVVLSIWWRD